MANPLCRKRERIYNTSIHNQFKLSRSWSKLPWYILAPWINSCFLSIKTHTHKKNEWKIRESFWRGNLKLSKERKLDLSFLCGSINLEASLTGITCSKYVLGSCSKVFESPVALTNRSGTSHKAGKKGNKASMWTGKVSLASWPVDQQSCNTCQMETFFNLA